ncbi:MAG: YbhB/YbcL family Raf kinase inhibitor-like protein [Aeromonadaceae bacterium]
MSRYASLTTPCAVLLSCLLASSSQAAQPGAGFTLTSPDIKAGSQLTNKQLFNGFGCSGDNISPALSWHGAPEGTQSYALTLYDPDAPTGSGWWHWVVFNIPAQSKGLPAHIQADGKGLPHGAIQSLTDFGLPGFGGACPPVGDKPHRYQFTLHALKVPTLDLPASSMPALVGFMIHANELASTRFTAYYGR